jgi:hypothetical protein
MTNLTRTLAVGALVSVFHVVAGTSVVAQERRNAEVVVVVVENRGYYDQHVYAIQGGEQRTIGLVTGLTTQRLELPRTFAEAGRDIRVLARPIAGEDPYLSPALMVSPGDQVNITLHTIASLSWATVTDPDVLEEEPEATPDGSPTGTN